MLKIVYFLRNLQASRANNSVFLGLRLRYFQGIVFISTQSYREIFKSTLVYL